MKLKSAIVALALLAPTLSQAAISISCGKAGDFNEDTYSYEPEYFGVGAADDKFKGPIGVEWDATLNDKEIRDKGANKVTISTQRDDNENLEAVIVTYARTNAKNQVIGKQYVVVSPYNDEPTLEVYQLYASKPKALKKTLPCISSMD